MKISPAELSDCDEIIQVQRLAYEAEARLYNDWTLPPLLQTPESLRQEFSASFILKAMNENKIIGSVRAELFENVCHIGRLIVHPDFQGQGIGSKLLRQIEDRFSQAVHYELFTGSKSEGNIRFYMRNNYEISHTKVLTEKISLVYLIKKPVAATF